MSVVVTRDFIMSGASVVGGWCREQTDILGAEFPLKTGWMRRAYGKRLSDADAARFISLKGHGMKRDTVRRLRDEANLTLAL